MSKPAHRVTAEWVTFAIASAVLLAVIALIAVQLLGSEDPADPVVRRAGAVREAADHYVVPVEVVNEGDVTAADVQVVAELTINGEVTGGDQLVDFLGGGEVEELAFVFADDPTQGELSIRVTSFAVP